MIALCRRVFDAPWFQNGVLALFVVVNFLIAIIIDNLEAVKGEARADADLKSGDATARLAAIRSQLEQIETTLRWDRPS